MSAPLATPSVESVLQELRLRQEEVERSLIDGQKTLSSNKTLQTQLKVDIGGLERASSDLDKSRTSAQQASEQAQRTWDAMRDVLEELSSEVRKEIDSAITAADTAISSKENEIKALLADVSRLGDEQANLDRELGKKETLLRTAISDLQQPASQLMALASAIQKSRTDLKLAAEAGQVRKVYVLAKELMRMKDDLDTLRKPEYEQQLVRNYTDAGAALKQQRTTHEQKQQEFEAKQQDLSKAKAELTSLKAERERKIKALFIP